MTKEFNREEILSYLKNHRDFLSEKYSLECIALIGSISRNEYSEESDVDLVVRFRPGTLRIHRLKQQLRSNLEEVFGRPVQIISEKYLRPYYREEILREAVYVED